MPSRDIKRFTEINLASVIPWDCSGYSEAADLVMKFFNADGGADLQDVVGSTGEVGRQFRT